jgi:nucleoside-diphosphate-sugar epimerase
MNIFVTGATGVIGRRAVPTMIAAGHRVTAVARTPQQAEGLAGNGAVPVGVDLFDREAVGRALSGQDAVVNLATHIPPSTMRMLLPGAWRENDRLRSEASGVLVDSSIAADVGRFVQESFAPVYPDLGDHWIHEETPIKPVSYNRTVADAEAAPERLVRRGGTGVVLRFAGFYGPDALQVLDMIKLVRKGWAPLPGSPDAFVSSISHDDAASAVVTALDLPTGTYNVADDEPLRRGEYAAELAAALGAASPKFLPNWLTRFTGSLGELMSRSQRISNRKLRARSSWAPKYPSMRVGWPATLDALYSPARLRC